MVVDAMPQVESPGVPAGPMPAEFQYAYRWERPLAPPPPPPEAVKRAETPAAPKSIRLGGVVLASNLVKRVMPEYPKLAINMRLSGTVRLLATVGIDGRVRELQLLDGHPLLVPAAMTAVRQWLYTPTLLNGEPVEVNAPIEVHFNLQH